MPSQHIQRANNLSPSFFSSRLNIFAFASCVSVLKSNVSVKSDCAGQCFFKRSTFSWRKKLFHVAFEFLLPLSPEFFRMLRFVAPLCTIVGQANQVASGTGKSA